MSGDRQSSRRPVLILAVLLFAAGAISRLAPLLNQGGRLYTEFPTEDGYLMLTIARNMAMGHGMSIADGHIPTNGVQPFAAFVYAGLYALAGGGKILGLRLVLLVQAAAAGLAAWATWRLGRTLLASRVAAAETSVLGAASWFAGRRAMQHSTNCLESGFVTLFLVLFCLAFIHLLRARRAGARVVPPLLTGILLGLGFWVRNDIVFLGAAALAVWCLVVVRSGATRRALFRDAVVMTGAAGILASPWLWYNHLRFGHVVPISGISESLGAEFGSGLKAVPGAILEQLVPIAPIPGRLHDHPLGLPLWIALGAAGIVLAARAVRGHSSGELRALSWLIAGYAGGMALYYGCCFRSTYFMNRYLTPISPLGALLFAGFIVKGHDSIRARRGARAANSLLAAVAAISLVIHGGLYARGTHHPHKAMFDVSRRYDIPATAWIGAFQSGVLGYFHDRTVNLDGKVNPEALAARQHGEIEDYIRDKRIDGAPIEYLVDDVWMADEARRPGLAGVYRVIVENPVMGIGIAVRTPGR